jgi:feruloyl esterase
VKCIVVFCGLVMTRTPSNKTCCAGAVAALALVFTLLSTAPVASQGQTAAADGCRALATLALPQATITTAELVAAGAFTPPTAGRGGRGGNVYASLPAFCRVAATITPSHDSDIKIEVWLPASGWNGRFQGLGNGGWAGSISYPALASAVAAGFAGASTDTGHTGNSGVFAVGHPEKLIDFGYRAVHEMTVKAKAIVGAYYGMPPRFSYWDGCSQGGRQGLAEALRYPADYDGIVAGAPAVNWIQVSAGRIAVSQAVNRTPAHAIPASKYALIHEAVLASCDGLDGVMDGVIENPARCHFDPQVLQCRDGDGPDCLTAEQVEAARALYAPVTHPRTNALVYPGLPPGTELGWGIVAGAQPVGTALDVFRYAVFGDANWDWRRFNVGTDLDLALAADKGVLTTNDTNLKPFFDRGGKVLLYHGWNDAQLAPHNSINYFNSVIDRLGPEVAGTSIELFMMPGVNHCQGGPGTDTFDRMAAIQAWVEQGRAPARILASRLVDGKAVRTRPLCPYGQVARWTGTGSTDDAANFMCVAEPTTVSP